MLVLNLQRICLGGRGWSSHTVTCMSQLLSTGSAEIRLFPNLLMLPMLILSFEFVQPFLGTVPIHSLFLKFEHGFWLLQPFQTKRSRIQHDQDTCALFVAKKLSCPSMATNECQE